MTDPAPICILHLSDIQFGRHHVDKGARTPLYTKDDYTPQFVKLVDDLEILKKTKGLIPNFIVATGDIAEWSLRDEYETADKFLGGLADHLQIERRQVVMVPGNHDINRKLCQAARLVAEAEGDPFKPPYFDKFRFYKSFFDNFYQNVSFPEGLDPYRFSADRLFENFYFPETGVVFLGLNSCINESELDPHYGNITVEQLKKSIDELNAMDPEAKLLRIALMHHNFVCSSHENQENLKDADDLKPLLLENNVRLILHGHQHMPREEVIGKGNQVIHVLATGSAGLDSEALPETPRRYQIITIQKQMVAVYRRFFDNTHTGRSGKGCWKPDMAPEQAEVFDQFTIEKWTASTPQPDRVETGPTCAVPGELNIPDAYQQWVVEMCGHMDVDKLREKGSAITVSLPEVFIPLFANPLGTKKRDEIEDPEMLLAHREHSVDIEDLIAEDGDLLISGEAGSGKTTLVKHFVYMAVGKPDWKDLGPVLPVIVYLKDLTGFDVEDANHDAQTARGLLQHSFRKSGCGLDVETVENYCAAGKALFFFDGLDEISLALRNLIVGAFSAFRRKCQGGRFIFSGRPHGVEGAVVDFIKERKLSILPLTMDQVEAFIKRWYQDVEGARSRLVQDKAEAMIQDVHYHPGVKRLIHNPLMLTAVCILYYDEKELPEQRAELYKKFVENMLHRRFTDPEPVYAYLLALAHEMHTNKEKGIGKDAAIKLLKTVYLKKDRSDAEYDLHLRETFHRIEPNCGLLKFDGGQMMFRHMTFQEYLTAAYIRDRQTKYDQAINEFWMDEWYKEVVELLVGLLSIDSRQWANDIVKAGLNGEDTVPYFRWRLAARSILDIHKDRREDEAVKLALEKLNQIILSPADAKDRAEAGRICGWLGDSRDFQSFAAIAAGTYELYIGTRKIKPFEISVYPVTNGWFARFVEEGYQTDEFWSPEGIKWRAHTGATQPAAWHDRKWNCANHPAVGVCWYEAAAFCRWLTASRQDGYTYRLPTERQWEAAAAGKKRRKYPWGKEFDASRCNTRETEIGRTSAVGIFAGGQTPEGVCDLAGNVWEWTNSDYHSKKELTDFRFDADAQVLYDKMVSSKGDDREELEDTYYGLVRKKDRQLPVLRGGSWLFDQLNARCVFRSRFLPLNRLNNVGFRCSRTKI